MHGYGAHLQKDHHHPQLREFFYAQLEIVQYCQKCPREREFSYSLRSFLVNIAWTWTEPYSMINDESDDVTVPGQNKYIGLSASFDSRRVQKVN